MNIAKATRTLLALLALLIAATSSHAAAHNVSDDGITVLVGAGQDTTVIDAFLPERIVVRVGQTVTWRQNGDEPHTVTFSGDEEHPPFLVPVPEGEPGAMMANPQVAFPTRQPGEPVETFDGTGYANSGLMSREPMGPDQPPNDTFSLTFTEPGTYEYHCAIHPQMHGVVEVVAADAEAEVSTPEDVSARADEQAAYLLSLVEAAREQGENVRSEPGPDGTTIWYVRAGGIDARTGDLRAHSFDFMPQELTIRAGDTVIWTSPEFHTVTFVPVPPTPDLVVPEPQEQGPPRMIVNQKVAAPAKPEPTYDPLEYYNSGLIGLFAEGGMAWALTFDEPGTFDYVCAVHDELGMEGTITVLPR